jgi:mannose-6-phosphate isomerase class I
VVEGSGSIDGHPVKKGDHLILPSGYGDVRVEGQLAVIASTPNK